MKKSTFVISLAVATVICGCATAPQHLNASGQPITFANPILGKERIESAHFVLLEKSVSDGRYHVVSISKKRQPITNERQERIAFSKDMTAFAPDYTNYTFETYVDRGNYGAKDVIMRCQYQAPKTSQYNPCNSAFGTIFIPTGITKAYVAGQMSTAAHKRWEDPQRNPMRAVRSPERALKQAGVFDRLSEVTNAN